MQTVALLMFFITVKLILYCFLKIANCCCSCARGHYMTMFIKWLESTLFFSDFIIITTETYLEFLID